MLRSVLFTSLLIAGLALPSTAEAACVQNYTSEVLVNDLTTLQLALRNLDEASFNAAGARMEVGLGCIGNPVPPMVFASAYRYIGAYRYLQNDMAGARKWFRTALELDPSYIWDANEVELDSPIRAMFEEERASTAIDPTPVAGRVLAQPVGSTFALDGRPLTTASATLDRPHVLQQIATADRSVRGTWIIDGNAIPTQFLQDSAIAGPTPAETKTATKISKNTDSTKRTEKVAEVEYTDSGAIKVARMRPAEKTPLMVIGATAIVAAGGLYAATFATRAEFEGANTTEELVQNQTMTNALVLASGGALLAGLGIGYWGIVLDGGAGVGVHGQF
jgi:hypothetical protein